MTPPLTGMEHLVQGLTYIVGLSRLSGYINNKKNLIYHYVQTNIGKQT